jgi:hypothetical protein
MDEEIKKEMLKLLGGIPNHDGCLAQIGWLASGNECLESFGCHPLPAVRPSFDGIQMPLADEAEIFFVSDLDATPSARQRRAADANRFCPLAE